MHSIIRNMGSITEKVPHLLLFKDPLARFRMSKRTGISKDRYGNNLHRMPQALARL